MTQKKKRGPVVLTGGAGFIGSCFLEKLNREGISDILVVDHLGSDEKWKNLLGKRFRDYLSKDEFLRLITDRKLAAPRHVIHMGACSSTVLKDADYYIANNYEYSKQVALWAFKCKAPLMYASSGATYGDGNQGYDDATAKLRRLRPLNMYGYSKHLFDLWLVDNGFEQKAAGLKFFNVFGPNEYHKGEMRSVIAKSFAAMQKEGVIRLFKSYHPDYKDGDSRRDFVYVKDCCDVMFWLFTHPRVTGIFNLGTGRARSWNDLARAMFKAAGKPPRIEYIDMPDYLRNQYQYFTEAPMAKLKAAGCPCAFRPLEEAVKDYAAYLAGKMYL